MGKPYYPFIHIPKVGFWGLEEDHSKRCCNVKDKFHESDRLFSQKNDEIAVGKYGVSGEGVVAHSLQVSWNVRRDITVFAKASGKEVRELRMERDFLRKSRRTPRDVKK